MSVVADQILQNLPSFILSLVAALSTAIYTWVTYLSLKELKQSRQLESQPNLVLIAPSGSLNIRLPSSDNTLLYFESSFDTARESKAAGPDHESQYRSILSEKGFPNLLIKNVGREAALAVEIEWQKRVSELRSKTSFSLVMPYRMQATHRTYSITKSSLSLIDSITPLIADQERCASSIRRFAC